MLWNRKVHINKCLIFHYWRRIANDRQESIKCENPTKEDRLPKQENKNKYSIPRKKQYRKRVNMTNNPVDHFVEKQKICKISDLWYNVIKLTIYMGAG